MRTVRNFVREGKLKAIRVGKQYRIATEDLVAMTGRPASSFEPEPILLMGAANSRDARQQPLRAEAVYNAERARVKIVLVGSMAINASMFKSIEIALES